MGIYAYIYELKLIYTKSFTPLSQQENSIVPTCPVISWDKGYLVLFWLMGSMPQKETICLPLPMEGGLGIKESKGDVCHG